MMTSKTVCFLLVSGMTLCTNSHAQKKKIDFAHDIVPILKKHCVGCHGGKESKGGFSLNTRGLMLESEAIVVGNAKKSNLIELVASSDPEMQMPPKGKPRVPAKDQAVLRRWVNEGLVWEPGWTFAEERYDPPLKPRRPKLPPISEGRKNPIDRIIDAYWKKNRIKRPTPLSDAAFTRRAYLDLTGLLPKPEQLKTFLQDPAKDKRSKLITTLINDRTAYTEHWLTFWNDLLRNAYSGTGFIDGGRKQMTEWLYRALYDNKPYDAFVREIIAPEPKHDGFIRGIKWRGDVNASQQREVQFAQSVSQVFLGINMKCASCHDSFIDRWTLKEAYGLAAIYSTKPLKIHRCDKPTGETAKAAWIFPELGTVDPNAKQPERLKQLADLLAHPQNGRMQRTIVNRLWHRMMGRGIVHPVDAMHTAPWNEDLLDFLASYLVEKKYDLKAVLTLIADSQVYQTHAPVQKKAQEDEFVFRGPSVKRLTAEQFVDAIWQITETHAQATPNDFSRDGRQQGGQLGDILLALGKPLPPKDAKKQRSEGMKLWNGRSLRAALTRRTPIQAALGRPNREQIVTTRPTNVSTLEAIQLANGKPLVDLLQKASQELEKKKMKRTEFINYLFTSALSRYPTSDEAAIFAGGEKITAQIIEDILWAVIMQPEFQLVR